MTSLDEHRNDVELLSETSLSEWARAALLDLAEQVVERDGWYLPVQCPRCSRFRLEPIRTEPPGVRCEKCAFTIDGGAATNASASSLSDGRWYNPTVREIAEDIIAECKRFEARLDASLDVVASKVPVREIAAPCLLLAKGGWWAIGTVEPIMRGRFIQFHVTGVETSPGVITSTERQPIRLEARDLAFTRPPPPQLFKAKVSDEVSDPEGSDASE